MNLRKKLKEARIRIRLAKHALQGKDFVRDAQVGHLLRRRSYQTVLPEYSQTPESEGRAALMARATEDEIRYVAVRDLRERWESGDEDIMRVVGEMARTLGYDADLCEALRTLEEHYRKDAVRNIRQRLEVEEREWDSGVTSMYVIRDPRLEWKMNVQITAKDHVTDEEPPKLTYAVEDAPDQILGQMVDSEEVVH